MNGAERLRLDLLLRQGWEAFDAIGEFLADAVDEPEPIAMMSTTKVATYLDVSDSTVNALRKGGDLRAAKIGGSWHFRRSDVDTYVDRIIERPQPEPEQP